MTLLTVLRPVSNQIGTTLVNDSFDADTLGGTGSWTPESGTSWSVVAAPSGLSGRAMQGVTDPSVDNYLRRTFTRQTGGILSIGWTLLSNSVVTGRSGSISVFDTSGGVVCQINVLNGAWGYANGSGQSGAFAGFAWGATGIYYPTIHINLDTKKYKFQLGTQYDDNAGAWYDLTTGTTGIDRVKFSVYSPAGGTFYIDDFQVGTRIPAATAPTTTGTLTTSGTFDGYTLGPDRFGQIVLGYANADANISNIRLERSANNSTWADLGGAQQQTIATGSGRWVVIDKRPQYGSQSVGYNATVYHRVSGFNSGGATPTSASGGLTSNINKTAFENARFAALSSIMAGTYVASDSSGEAYPQLWLGAMAFAYARTGTAQYLTDATNQWNYMKTLTGAGHGCFQMPDYTDFIYRDHHWRAVLWAAACSRVLRSVGATTVANDMVAQADTWVANFAALNSGTPRASNTLQGFDANDDSLTNNQRVWVASTAYAVGAIVTPTARNGRTYRVTTAGTTAGTQPTWPTTNGGTVTNGTVTFTETAKTGSVAYTTYSTTAPYNGTPGEAIVDLNQNAEEAAALALLTADPNSALSSAGAAKTAALLVITDVTNLMTTFATSTGAIPIGNTYPAINGDEGYDTLYGAYTVETGTVIYSYAAATANQYLDEMIVKGLTWLDTSYGTEPVTGKHYTLYAGVYSSEITMREYAHKVFSVTNPLLNVRYTSAINTPLVERPTDNYDASGSGDTSMNARAARTFASDPFIYLFETTGIKVFAPPASATASMPVPFNPAALTGLRLWLKADDMGTFANGDPVGTWPDRSTQAASFTAAGTARPTYVTNALNGKPVVSFDGTTDAMVGPAWSTVMNVTSGVYTIVALAKIDAAPTIAGELSTAVIGDTNANMSMVAHNVSGALKMSAVNYSGGVVVAGPVASTYGAWHTIAQDHDNTTLRIKVDGGTFATAAAGATDVPTNVMLMRNAFNDAFDDGDLAEVLVYNRVLSDAERGQVETYLTAKWLSAASGPVTVVVPAAGATASAPAPVVQATDLPPAATSTATSTAPVALTKAITPAGVSTAAAASPVALGTAASPAGSATAASTAPVDLTRSVTPAGSATAGATAPAQAVTETTPAASASAGSSAPVVNVVSTEPPGVATASASNPTIVLTANPVVVVVPAANATASAVGPAQSATAASPAAPATALATSPVVLAKATATAGNATATGAATAVVSETTPAASATATATGPVVKATSGVPAGIANASASPPTVPAAPVILPVPAAGATASVSVPVSSTTTSVPAAGATSTTTSHALTARSMPPGGNATATGAATATVTVTSPVGASTASGPAPIAKTTVTGTAANATATFPPPGAAVPSVVQVPAAAATATAAATVALTTLPGAATATANATTVAASATAIPAAALATASATGPNAFTGSVEVGVLEDGGSASYVEGSGRSTVVSEGSGGVLVVE